jgi:hypothetical protein
VNTPAKNNSTNTLVQPNGCFKCGELGHYANNCPKHNQQTPQRNINQRADQNTPTRGPAQNKTPQNQSRERVNHVTVESVPKDANMVYGELRATHSCPQTNIEIRGLSFLVELIILESSGIDVILGIDYLTKYDGVISCAKRMVT